MNPRATHEYKLGLQLGRDLVTVKSLPLDATAADDSGLRWAALLLGLRESSPLVADVLDAKLIMQLARYAPSSIRSELSALLAKVTDAQRDPKAVWE